MDNETLAMEILHELKSSAKRWFIAFCIMIGLEICTIVGFLWYISLPVEDISMEQVSSDRSLNNIGGYINGIETEGYVQAESSSQ
jgi:hypothetical protein